MKRSEKLKLWLPEGSDPLEISKLSENFEKLDPLGGGLEAMKEGTGPGSLFMVSKYYKEPIENAVLCDGGSVDVSEYPELADVLGMTYGVSVSSTYADTAYGITSTLGYPQAYNPDLDMYVYFNAGSSSIVLYRKGQKAERIPFASGMPASNAGSNVNFYYKYNVLSFRHYVVLQYSYPYNDDRDTSAIWMYDIDTDSWANVGLIDGCFRGVDFMCLVDAGDFILSTRPYRLIDKETADHYELTIKKENGSAMVASVEVLYPCISLDDSNYVYLYYRSPGVSNDTLKLYRLQKDMQTIADDQTVQLELVKDLTGRSSAMPNTVPMIFDGYIYGLSTSRIFGRINLASNTDTWENLYTAPSSDTLNGFPVVVKEVSENVIILCYSQSNKCLVVSGSVIRAAEFYGMLGLPLTARSGPALTTSGVMDNLQISGVTLPTITMPEALVYMRTSREEHVEVPGEAEPDPTMPGDPDGGGGEGGTAYQFGHGLKLTGSTVSIATVDNFEGDNTLPMTAAGVQAVVGDIEALLGTI